MYRCSLDDAEMGTERLRSLIVLESALDDEIERLESEYEWESRKLVYLQALECENFHLREIALKLQRSRGLVNVYKSLLEQTFVEKLMCVAIVKKQQDQRHRESELQQQCSRFSHQLSGQCPYHKKCQRGGGEGGAGGRERGQKRYLRSMDHRSLFTIKVKGQRPRSSAISSRKTRGFKALKGRSKQKTPDDCVCLVLQGLSQTAAFDLCKPKRLRYQSTRRDVHFSIPNQCKHYSSMHNQHDTVSRTNQGDLTWRPLDGIQLFEGFQPMAGEHGVQRAEPREERQQGEELMQAVSDLEVLCFGSELVQGFLDDENRV